MKAYNEESIRSITRVSRAFCIILLVLHFYIECYPLFFDHGWRSNWSDKILGEMLKTGWVRPFAARGLAMLFLELMALVEPAKKQWTLSFEACVWRLGYGFVFFWGSYWFLSWPLPYVLDCILYIGMTLYGMRLSYIGLSGLFRMLPLPWRPDDHFGEDLAGFPQLQKKLISTFSLHLPARYKWKGKEYKSWINLVNPRRGVFILGSPGSGKSWFIIEPFIRQWMEKGNALFLYDFKYDTLTRLAYHYFQQYRDRFPPGTGFYSINFGDVTRSHRCNLIHPSTIDWISDALGISRTILLSINTSWVDKQGDFFVESPVNFLAAVIWFLRQYEDGRYCTLPHVIELGQLSYGVLFEILSSNHDLSTLIDPFKEAWINKTYKMLDGQIASARIPLSRLASPDVYYILTGDDLTLDINNPLAPKVFCLGGDPVRQEALAPVLSLYIDRVNKICNRPGQVPLAMVVDEFASVRAYSMATTLATGRSNNIVPILAVQDLSQLRTNYTRNEADLFMNASGNLICGQVGGETAKWVSERFPNILQERASVSTNSDEVSVSTARYWEPTVTPATIGTLSSGEFVGVVSDDPDNPLDTKIFHAKLEREEPSLKSLPGLPVVREVTKKAIEAHFLKVKWEIGDIAGRFKGGVKKDGKDEIPMDM